MSLIDDFNQLQNQPARRFEKDSGLSGIAVTYHIPDGRGPLAYENLYVSKNRGKPGILADVDLPPVAWLVVTVGAAPEKIAPLFLQRLREGWEKLAALNPPLQKLAFDRDDPVSLTHALIGATSGFNTDDIQFYLNLKWAHDTDGYPLGPANLPDGYDARLARIEKSCKADFEWYPSPKTLARIEKMINPPTQKRAGPKFR